MRIRVISAAEEAELTLNGRSLGRRKIGGEEKLTAYFETEYEPGVLEAICYTAGTEVGRSFLKTAGTPAKISVQTVNPVMAAVRGSGEPGEIRVTFTSDGLPDTQVILNE